jgi:hypothetical protein
VSSQFLERPPPTEYRLEVRSLDRFPDGVGRLQAISKNFGTALRVVGDAIEVVPY